MSYLTIKQKIYNSIEKKEAPHSISMFFHVFMIILILANVLITITETVESFYQQFSNECELFEQFTTVVFICEYIFRIWCCNAKEKWNVKYGRLKFAMTPLMIVDLLSILPVFIPFFVSSDLFFLRITRLSRIFRLFKLCHYSKAFDVINNVFNKKREYLIISFMFMFSILIIVSCIMYIVEHQAQPDVFSSIPATMWWGIITMTTVGYGDAAPITPIGKFITSIVAIIGIATFTLPAAVLSSGFFEELQQQEDKQEDKKEYCPHCGKKIE